jgi:hypothetical protein
MNSYVRSLRTLGVLLTLAGVWLLAALGCKADEPEKQASFRGWSAIQWIDIVPGASSTTG